MKTLTKEYTHNGRLIEITVDFDIIPVEINSVYSHIISGKIDGKLEMTYEVKLSEIITIATRIEKELAEIADLLDVKYEEEIKQLTLLGFKPQN